MQKILRLFCLVFAVLCLCIGTAAADTDVSTYFAEYSDTFTATNSAGTTAWIVTDDGLKSGMEGKRSASGVLTLTFIADTALSFDYRVSSEKNYDKFLIDKNGTNLATFSGEVDWTAYEVEMSSGDVLTLTYSKDYSGDKGDDCVYLKNFAVLSSNAVSYKVHYYIERLGGGFTVSETVTKKAEPNTPVIAEAKEIAGFTFDTANASNVTSGNASADLELALYYTRNSYTLAWDFDGGEAAGDYTTGSVLYGASIIAPVPTRTQYTFKKWDKTVPSTMPAEDLTLTAEWEAAKYTLTFDVGEGSVSPAVWGDTYGDEMKVIYGQKYGEYLYSSYSAVFSSRELPVPTHGSLAFAGWFTAAEGGEQITADSVVTITADSTLYAHYSEAFIVTLHYNDGATESESIPVAQGSAFGTAADLPAPRRTGYTFNGWFDASENELTKDTVISTAVTYTAKWTPYTYTVIFYKNGSSATGTMASQSFTYDTEQALSLCTFTKPGCRFVGWSSSSWSSTVAYTDGQTVKNLSSTNNGTRSLYALWEEVRYTLTFAGMPDGSTVTVKNASGTAQSAQSDGSYSLPEGDYTYTVEKYGYKSASGSVSMTENRRVTVTMDKLAEYAVTFVLQGEKPGGAGESVIKVYFGETEMTAESGVYTLAVGDYTYEIKTSGCNKVTGSFSVVDKALEISYSLSVRTEWDGATRTEPQVKTIDGAEYYTITNGDELAWFADHVNEGGCTSNAILEKDIDLGNEKWTPMGSSYNVYFGGIFDGNGKTVSGLYCDGTTYQGLFGYSKGEIRDLTAQGTVNGTGNFVGGIAGYANGGKIENCISEVSVTTEGYAGGIVGYANGTEITSCLNRGEVNSDNYAGGIAGYVTYGAALKNCANMVAVTTTGSRAGGIAGYLNYSGASIANCYNVGTVTAEDDAAGILGFMGTSGSPTVTDCYYQADSAGSGIGNTDSDSVTAKTEAEMKTAAFVIALGVDSWNKDDRSGYPVPASLGGTAVSADEIAEAGKLNEIAAALPSQIVPNFWKYPTEPNVRDIVGDLIKEAGFDDAVTVTIKSGTEEGKLDADGNLYYYYKHPSECAADFAKQFYNRVTPTLTLSLGDALIEYTPRITMYWDLNRLQDAALIEISTAAGAADPETLFITYAEDDSSLAVTQNVALVREFEDASWLRVKWTASPSGVINITDDESQGLDYIHSDYIGKVNRAESSRNVILNAIWDFPFFTLNSGEATFEDYIIPDSDPAETTVLPLRTFSLTVKGTETGTETAMQKILDQYTNADIKDFFTRESIGDGSAVQNDLQMLTPAELGILDREYDITYEIDAEYRPWLNVPDVTNAARIYVFRPTAAEGDQTVKFRVVLTSTADAAMTVSKEFTVTLQALDTANDAELIAAKTNMDYAVANLFAFIKGTNTSSRITADLDSFYGLYVKDGKLTAFDYIDKPSGAGIVAVLVNPEEYTPDDRHYFVTDAPAVIAEDSLFVTREKNDTTVKITACLTYDAYAHYLDSANYPLKYAEIGTQSASEFYNARYADSIIGDLYRRTAECTVTVRGTSGGTTVSTPSSSTFSVSFTLKGIGSDTWIRRTTVKGMTRSDTVWDVFKEVLDANDIDYSASGSYVRSVTSPDGEMLAEGDHGKNSGWLYSVNGELPDTYMNRCYLASGDKIVFYYYTDGDEIPEEEGGETKEEKKTDTEPQRFIDVPSGIWYCDAVYDGVAKGYILGISETLFAPDVSIDRASFAALLYRLAGSPAMEQAAPFDDVAADTWYASAIAWAAENGIVQGIGDDLFAPDVTITREQIAVMLAKFFALRGITRSDSGASLDDFSDADAVSDYAKDAMREMVRAGILTGMNDGRVDPRGNATRAQIAVLIMRTDAVL